MFDHFLTSILQVVIVVDILGAIAYFVLGGMKQKKRQALQATLNEQTVEVVPLRKPLRERFASKSPFAFFKRFSRNRPRPVPANQGDFDQLRRILYSYQEGLA